MKNIETGSMMIAAIPMMWPIVLILPVVFVVVVVVV